MIHNKYNLTKRWNHYYFYRYVAMQLLMLATLLSELLMVPEMESKVCVGKHKL